MSQIAATTPDLPALQTLLASSGVLCALYRAEGWLVSPGLAGLVSREACWEVWGEDRWASYLHKEDLTWQAKCKGLAEGQAFTACQIRLRSMSGAWLRLSARGEVHPCGPVLLFEDITVKTQIESALHDSQTRLNSLHDSAPVAIILWSKEGRITGWNSAAEKTFAFPRDAVMGQKLVPLLIASEDYELFSKAITASVSENDGKDVVCRTLTRHGEVLYCRWRSVPLRTRKGALQGIFSLALDVTAEHAAAESLRLAKDSAEHLSKAKSEFMAVIGHELRTPLNGIIGLTQVLQSFIEGDEEQKMLQSVIESGEGLLDIVNAIMRYARADLVPEEALQQPLSLFELCATNIQVYELQAQRKSLKLNFDFDMAIPDLLYGDEEGTRTVFCNLIANAVRFTEVGEVTVSVLPGLADKNVFPVTLTVKDTGVGMASAFMEKLYTPFLQAESAFTRKQGGVGLGLALVRKLVDRQGASIRAESELGAGTTFSVTFNFALSPSL